MINANESIKNMINSPVRALRGRVEVYEGSTLTLMCGCHDSLKEFTVERLGESKFFGYGVCQKINVALVDIHRNISISTANTLEVVFGVGSDYIYPFPSFYVTEVHRDEKTNELSITAYDALYSAANHTVSELNFTNYTIGEFATACAGLLGLPINTDSIADPSFNTLYETGANFDGTETIREALNAIAEATQTIYFIDWDWKLTFKKLDINGAAVATIDKEKYIELDSGTNRRLTSICHVTELGDNIIADLGVSGTTQYIRDNPFWDMREDTGALIDAALANIGGLTINQFSCKWRGNFLLEIGDKIELITRDNNSVFSYVLNDSINFNGSLSEVTEWSYEDSENETAGNPTSLGDALKQTFAKVDKVNKQIDLVASEVSANSEAIAGLQITTEGVTASVSKIEEDVIASIEGLNQEISTLTTRVDASITSEDVTIAIQSEIGKGVDKVTTSTGFTFNEEGLTVSKTDSEMTTLITEDGMTVYKNDEAVLVANNAGVNAVNLHATTYLIIGTNSRFEDYDGNRTGCFWIGN